MVIFGKLITWQLVFLMGLLLPIAFSNFRLGRKLLARQRPELAIHPIIDAICILIAAIFLMTLDI